ncbi:lipopolysaccharide biosynthesis protein [Microlunatus endophyticus]|uniref:Lipopolysaccharide biosynthesis protein n=1 Tax=Microlunatus endophyticus TaxID=1716077 RepID=A0A917W3S7_9ACTN|nr:lipopolysaccharide biosynthesis protein [Microlunatus endophyticus]GGL59389.1 lipopolysaccharide biosynthesis protein [Microlunatus endophyticus]
MSTQMSNTTEGSTSGAPDSGDLGRRAARGASVVYLGQGARLLLQVASTAVLARLLSPTDYGLLAMVMAVVGVGEIFRDFGLSTAAIQADSLNQGQRATLFWLNTGIGAVLTGVALLGAPLIARGFGYPELVGMTHALAFTFLLNGMAAQYRAHLVRDLRFTTTTVRDVISQVLGVVVAIGAALLGAGYWALVAQQLVQAGVGLLILVSATRWLPLRPGPIRAVRPMIHYGWNLAASQLVAYMNSNVDTLTVSFRFGAAPLGIYSRGFQLLMRPLGQLRGPTNNIAVPVLSRLRADPNRANGYVVKGQVIFGYTLVPGMALVFAAATPIVMIFLGRQWGQTGPIVAALACAGAFETLAYVGSWVYQARGLTPQLFRYSLMSLAIKIVCVVGGSQFGLLGVAVGYAIAPGLAWPLSLWWLGRLTDLPKRQLWLGAGRILACAVPAALVGRLMVDLLHTSSLVQALAAAAAVGVVYAAALLVKPIRRDVSEVFAVARKALAR